MNRGSDLSNITESQSIRGQLEVGPKPGMSILTTPSTTPILESFPTGLIGILRGSVEQHLL